MDCFWQKRSQNRCLESLVQFENHLRGCCSRGDFPAFTPTEAGTRFSDPEGMQGWVDLGTLGANSLPKIFTPQRRDCDSNPCSSELESGMLTTRPPSHPSGSNGNKNVGGSVVWWLATVHMDKAHVECCLSRGCSGGVRPGDVITAIDGNAVTSSADVYKAVNYGKSLRLTILRTDSSTPVVLSVTPETVE